MKRSILILLLLFTVISHSQTMKNLTKKATFGAGCFWCIDPLFSQLKGVQKVVTGYSGGHTLNPTYETICTGTTGHAEVIEITFDSQVISYQELLAVFWQIHDPTTLNQQGADVGTQYRSVVFYHSEEQKKEAIFYKNKLNENKVFLSPVVTEISEAVEFYQAENYHQDYYNTNPNAPYCQAVITPKIEKFKQVFIEKIK